VLQWHRLPVAGFSLECRTPRLEMYVLHLSTTTEREFSELFGCDWSQAGNLTLMAYSSQWRDFLWFKKPCTNPEGCTIQGIVNTSAKPLLAMPEPMDV
jgi:hypothetical protein